MVTKLMKRTRQMLCLHKMQLNVCTAPGNTANLNLCNCMTLCIVEIPTPQPWQRQPWQPPSTMG